MLQVRACGPVLPSVLKLHALRLARARVVGDVARARGLGGVQLEGGFASGDKVSGLGGFTCSVTGPRSCQWNLWLRGRSGRGLPCPTPRSPHTSPPEAHTPDTLWARADIRQPKYACAGHHRSPTSTSHCDHEIAATGWHVPHGFPPCAASAPTPSHLKPPP